MMTDEEMYTWDNLIEYGIATEDELMLAIHLCGMSMETLNSVLFIRSGYRSFEQMKYEEDKVA